MTEDRRRRTGVRRLPSCVLLGLYLCVLALRVTYTESPTAQTAARIGLSDTAYSLTLSGLLIFGFVFWLVWRICTDRFTYRFTGIEIGLAVFLVACLVSTAGASDKRLAISQVVILLGPILAALLVAQLLDSPLKIRLVLIIVGALAVVSAYQSAEQFLVSNQITIEQYEKAPETLLEPLGIEPGSFQQFLFEHRLYSRGIRGFFTTSNSAASFGTCAAFTAIALLASRWQALRKRRERLGSVIYILLALVSIAAGLLLNHSKTAIALLASKWQTLRQHWKEVGPAAYELLALVLVAAIVIAGLLLTQSKGGILGFVLAGLLFALLLYRGKWLLAHRRSAWALLALAMALSVAAVWLAVSYGLKHGRLPGGNSMLVRWQYWVASVQMVQDHPLAGVGPGNFAENYLHYKPAAAPESVADPHSLPLSLLAQYGPLGLLGFLAMVLGPIIKSLRGAAPEHEPSARQSPAKGPALATLAGMCAALLVLRPILIPMPATDDVTVATYQIVALYVAPAAAFLIGFLLLAAPMIGPGGKRNGARSNLLPVALGCAVFGVLVHNLIDFAIFEPGVWMTFWLLLACLVALRSHQQELPSGGRTFPARSKAIAVIVALALLAAFWHYAWRPAYDVGSRVQRAQRAAAMGLFEQAHRLYEAAFQADPLSSAPLSLRGSLYVQQYEEGSERRSRLLEEAAQSFRRAAQVSPADYRNYEKLGTVYTRLDRYEHAYEWYSRAIERYPGSGRLRFERAQAAERVSDALAALADYRQAVEIEEAYRAQFRTMYPEREIVSRLGEERYQTAKARIAELSR
ncbi:MAG: O-antigen ligase family protein [Sedimentisphaerales bacterium]|nr:O-antigen ligase family protein [Sedimentisphaerales bacterium]